MTTKKGKTRKKLYRIGNLEDTFLDDVEKYNWIQSHREMDDLLDIPDRSCKRKPNILTDSWFSCAKMRPSKQENIVSLDSLANWVPQRKDRRKVLARNNDNLDVILRCKTYLVHAEEPLLDKIRLAMEATAYIYNRCVRLAREGPVKLGDLRNMFVTAGGSRMPEELIEKFKGIHYDIKDGAIDDFKAAYRNQLQAVKDKRVKKFTMKYMKKKYRSINIRSRQITLNEDKTKLTFIFTDWKYKGQKLSLSCKEKLANIDHTVKLLYRNKKLYLAIPIEHVPKKISNGKVVALDPGVRSFQMTYDSRGVSYNIGERDVIVLDEMKKRACELRQGWKTLRDKRVVPGKPTKSMKRLAARIETKISNKVQDMHRKLVKFLCKSYDTIIIPPFSAKSMTSRKHARPRKISRTTARQMYLWSHYKFRSLLISKGEQTGTRIEVENEHCTSMTCSRCLFVNGDLGAKKVYQCDNCKLSLSRDINGARNILIKNWHVL